MNSRYKLKITGKNIKRFINDLIQQKVLLYDISMFDKYVLIVVDEDGYAQIKKIKTSYKIEVVDSFGKAKIIDIIKKYRFFLLRNYDISLPKQPYNRYCLPHKTKQRRPAKNTAAFVVFDITYLYVVNALYYFAAINPFAVRYSAHRTAPPAAPRTVL